MNARSLILVVLCLSLLPTAAPLHSQDQAAGKLTPGPAQSIVAAKGRRASPAGVDIDALLDAASADERGLEGEENPATFSDGNTQYLVLNLEFKDAASCQEFALPGTKLLTRHERFADIFAKAQKTLLEEVEKYPGLVKMDYDRDEVFPPPARPVPKKETPRATAEKIVRGGLGGLTGKGVVVAVIDSGVDFRHPDFISYDAAGKPTSRLLYFWDTGSDAYANGVGDPAPITFPNAAPIGTIYSQAVLTDDLRSGRLKIPVWDPNGHGTSCAGIAAGNGSVNKDYTGVAPAADIIGIRAATGASSGMDNAYLVNAICEWLDKVVGARPLVVTCSWGGQYGGRDGFFVRERHLDARFPPSRKSRAICFSAGNEGHYPIHAPLTLGPEATPAKITWTSRSPSSVAIYLQVGDDSDIKIGRMGGLDLSKLKSEVHPLSKELVIYVPIPAGVGGLFLYTQSGAKVVGDAYIGRDAEFSEECFEIGKQVGTPGSARNVLTIGSYDWNDQFHMHGQLMLFPDNLLKKPLSIGSLSTYSSPGPLRVSDIVKPELVAPGQYFAAPAAMNVVSDRDSTGLYQLFNGTSAATPYAAGVIALMLEANPNLTFGEIRQALIESATQDAMTKQCPNPRWGHGKLDYAAIERALKRVKK